MDIISFFYFKLMVFVGFWGFIYYVSLGFIDLKNVILIVYMV